MTVRDRNPQSLAVMLEFWFIVKTCRVHPQFNIFDGVVLFMTGEDQIVDPQFNNCGIVDGNPGGSRNGVGLEIPMLHKRST